MATRSRTTFKKRQKELARLEKQRDKAARRMQRKLEKSMGITTGDSGDEDLASPAEGPGVQDENPEEVHPETPTSGVV